MWRFVLICLVFMGWAFFHFSGGTSYEPVPNSIQAQARLPESQRMALKATPSQDSPVTTELAALAEVETVMATLQDTQDEAEQLTLTLAAVSTDAAGIYQAEADRPKAELLAMELPAASQGSAAIDSAVSAALGDVSFDDSQIRWVKENIIDLRTGPGLTFDRVSQVSKGTEVAVLEDPGHGWLNVQVVDNYQSGWVAEWLLIKPE